MTHDYTEEFAAFYRAFPNRTGKLAAQKAYTKARKLASQQELIDGVDRYIANKPEWQAFAHPATWLNAGRWMDEGPKAKREHYEPWRCPHVPKCHNRVACGVVSARPSVAPDRKRRRR